jgi:hypothetical protein
LPADCGQAVAFKSFEVRVIGVLDVTDYAEIFVALLCEEVEVEVDDVFCAVGVGDDDVGEAAAVAVGFFEAVLAFELCTGWCFVEGAFGVEELSALYFVGVFEN